MDPQLSPANSSPLSPFTEPIEPSNGPPSPSSLSSLQTLLHMHSNGKVQAEGSVGRPPSDSSDLSSFDGSDDEPVSQETKGLPADEEEDEDEDDEEDDDDEDEDDEEEEEEEEEEDDEEEPEADLPTPVKRQLHQQPYKQQQSSPSTFRHRPSRSPIVNRPTLSGPLIATPSPSVYPSTRSPKLKSPSGRAGSRTPTSNRHLRQSTTPSNLRSNNSPSSPLLGSASAASSVAQPTPSISLLASHVSATQQDQGTRVFPPAPQSLSSTLSDSDEEPDEEDDDEDEEGHLDMDIIPDQERKPVGAGDVDMGGEADEEIADQDEDEDEEEDRDSVRAETTIRSQDMDVSPKPLVPTGGPEVKTPQDPVNLGPEDIQVEEGELLENDALSETGGINHVKHDHLFVPPSTVVEPTITAEDEQVASELNGDQTQALDDIKNKDDPVSEPLSEDREPLVVESVKVNGQANSSPKEENQQQSIAEEKEPIEEDEEDVKGTDAVEVTDEQSRSEDQPKVPEASTKPDVVVTAVDDNPTGVPPSHSLLAQQRADALEALLKIEITFARLRDKFHVERMEQCLREEEQLLDESHPILAHFQSRLSDLRARELVFMGKRSKTFEVSLEKVQQADIEAIWEWWRNGREELQRDMMADVMRKRRRVDREKRAVEGGRPKRPLPIPPPNNTSKRVRQDSQPPDLEDLLPGSFFHHRPEERRRIREEREAIGPRPGLLGLDERSREVDLQLLGIGPSMRFRPFEQAQHPLMVPSNSMAHHLHHHHHHPLHPPPPPQSTAQLASQQYHNVHYAPGPSHHAMSLSGGSQGIPYPFRQGMSSYSAELPQHQQQQQPLSHQHSNLQSQHQNQHMHVHYQPPLQSTLSSSQQQQQQQQQASQQQQHNSHPYLFDGLSNGGSFGQPHIPPHPGASFET